MCDKSRLRVAVTDDDRYTLNMVRWAGAGGGHVNVRLRKPNGTPCLTFMYDGDLPATDESAMELLARARLAYAELVGDGVTDEPKPRLPDLMPALCGYLVGSAMAMALLWLLLRR